MDTLSFGQRDVFLGCEELSEKEFKGTQRQEEADEIQQMQDGGLPIPAGLEDPEDESNQPGVERAPVAVDGVCEITAKVGAGDV